MVLNHINLTVGNAARAASFLTTYFGMRKMGQRGRNELAVFVPHQCKAVSLHSTPELPCASGTKRQAFTTSPKPAPMPGPEIRSDNRQVAHVRNIDPCIRNRNMT